MLEQKKLGLAAQGLAAKELDAKDMILYVNFPAIRPRAVPAIQQGFPQGFLIFRGLYGGIAFYQVAQPCIVVGGKVKVVYAYLCRYPLFRQW